MIEKKTNKQLFAVVQPYTLGNQLTEKQYGSDKNNKMDKLIVITTIYRVLFATGVDLGERRIILNALVK